MSRDFHQHLFIFNKVYVKVVNKVLSNNYYPRCQTNGASPDPPLVGSPISLSIGGLDPVGFGFLIVLSFGGSYPSLWGTLDGLSRDLASISLIRIMKMDKIVKNFIMANEGTKVTN